MTPRPLYLELVFHGEHSRRRPGDSLGFLSLEVVPNCAAEHHFA